MTLSLSSAPPGPLAPEPLASGPLALHKRRPPAGPAFVLPGFACFACADTGIVGNHDRAINEFLPDYDVLPTGEVCPGSDPAVICCCNAAYAREGRGGYRDSAGPRRIEALLGPRLVGCDLHQQAIATIHRNRRQIALAGVQATAEQARQMKASREAVAGLLPAMPRGGC
jgi:hypothetical protein